MNQKNILNYVYKDNNLKSIKNSFNISYYTQFISQTLNQIKRKGV